MTEQTQQLIGYLNKAHSVYHAVNALVEELTAAGYTCLRETEAWKLEAGGKYYFTRGQSALIAFRIPEDSPKGFQISASHADRPCFKVKTNGELTGTYTRLAVERYGGMLMSTWLDRPLSVAGRVLVETEEGVESRLVDIDRDLLLIPNVAIHMNRKINDGYAWNPAVDLLPLLGGKGGAGKLNTLLENTAGGKILDHDLYLYVRQKASVWGVEEEFLSAPALDDLVCAWCCTQGFLKAQCSEAVCVLSVFDSEEVGSSTSEGAASDLLESALRRICDSLSLGYYPMLAQSFMVSADNGHAIHPNHPEYADGANGPVLGEGIVIKYNANRKYTTDGLSAALFRKICNRAGVPVQTYCNRADLPGGSTLGNISLSHVSVPSVDIGVAQLAMHSCYETAAVRDARHLEDAMAAYYSATLQCREDGSFRV